MAERVAQEVAAALIGRLEALPGVAELVRHLLRALHGQVPAAACFACGGLVRDLGLGAVHGTQVVLKDVDLMVDRASTASLQEIVGRLAQTCPALLHAENVGVAFPVWKLKLADLTEPVDLAPARTGRSFGGGGATAQPSPAGLSLEDDAAHRDFTFNAMFVELKLTEDGRLRGTLHDPHGGLESIRRREIRCVGDADERLAEDPLRGLRGVRFAATLPGFELHPSTLAAIQRHAPAVKGALALDRLAGELARALSGDPHRALAELERSGLAAAILPQLAALGAVARARCAARIRGVTERLGCEVEPAVVFAALLVELAVARDAQPVTGLDRDVAEPWSIAGAELRRVTRELRLPNLRRIWRLCSRVLVLGRYPGRLDFPEARVEEALAGAGEGPQLLALYGAHQQALARDPVDLMAVLATLPPSQLDFGRIVEQAGAAPGPRLATLRLALRQAEIDGTISDQAGAWALFDELYQDRVP